jgi:hypothetical protein
MPVDALRQLTSDENAAFVRVRRRGGRAWVTIRNEFAMVELGIETDSNGVRVRVRDAETGEGISLDPLELEALTRLDHRDFGPLILR